MGFLEFWLRRGFSVSKSWRFGPYSEPGDQADKHCVDCGVKRKDHSSASHPFREVDI